MKKLIKSMLIMLLTQSCSSIYAQNQGQLFALANQPKQTDNLQYSTYNFVNLKPDNINQENNITLLNSGYNDRHVPVGPLIMGAGILTVVVGAVGMDISKNGIDNFLANNNSNNNGDMKNWKSYNTYCDVALAGGALIITGLIIAAVNGDLRSGHYEGFRASNSYGGYSSGGWKIGRAHV